MLQKPWLLVLPILLGACSTPQPVRDFSTVTAANVSIVNSALARFADDSQALAQERAQAMQDLSNQLDRSERQLAEDTIVLERTETGASFNALRNLIRESREIQLSDRQQESQKLLEQILAERSRLSAPRSALNAVSKTLGALGEERDASERLRFFVRFASQVVDDIEQAKELQAVAKDDARSRLSGAKTHVGSLGSDR